MRERLHLFQTISPGTCVSHSVYPGGLAGLPFHPPRAASAVAGGEGTRAECRPVPLCPFSASVPTVVPASLGIGLEVSALPVIAVSCWTGVGTAESGPTGATLGAVWDRQRVCGGEERGRTGMGDR